MSFIDSVKSKARLSPQRIVLPEGDEPRTVQAAAILRDEAIAIPVLALLDYIDAHSTRDVRLMCSRAGGFVSFFGTADSDEIHARVAAGDPAASLAWRTMIYQISKQIGEMAAVLRGKVDAILLTGGLVRFADIPDGIRDRCGWIAPVAVYPGEMEQSALALSVLRALRGEDPILTYTGRPVWPGFADIGL